MDAVFPETKLPLDLSRAQRRLVLERLPSLPAERRQAIAAAPSDGPILMTLDDLEFLRCHVAAGGHHTRNQAVRKGLDAVFSKILTVVESSAPPALGLEQARIADRLARLAGQVGQTLDCAAPGPRKARILERFPLAKRERAVLLRLDAIPPELKKKLRSARPRFSPADVSRLAMAIVHSLVQAEPLAQSELLSYAERLIECLHQGIGRRTRPARKVLFEPRSSQAPKRRVAK